MVKYRHNSQGRLVVQLNGPVASPSEVLSPWEHIISSWAELLEVISVVQAKHAIDGQHLVWRGVTSAEFGLYSSLYRRLKRIDLNFEVSENDMVSHERRILKEARGRWRLDNLPALELLAHIQHYGGPTRLIDVSDNPLVGCWFAAEEQRDESGGLKPDIDGWLFCFYVGKQIELDDTWGGRSLPWLDWQTPERVPNGWGNGDGRL